VHRLTRLSAATLAAAGILAGAAGAAPALAAEAGQPADGFAGVGAHHAVFVQNDRLEGGNQIIAYDRSTAGTLTQAGIYNTGGNGGKLEGAVVDHTASQGALTFDRADNLLLAVNPGSSTLSVFAVFGDRLALRQVIGSGGKFPVSVTASGGTVYVLNAEEGGSLQGYTVSGGRLFAIPGSQRALGLPLVTPGSNEQFTHTPGQVTFSLDGSKLIVTTKAAGQSIDVFSISHFGRLSGRPVVNSEPGTVPFGVTFDKHGNLLVTEAGPSALASFQLNDNGTLAQLDALATEQKAACWVQGAAGYFYTSNAGSATVTGFQSTLGGQLLTKLGNTETHPGTVDATAAGRFLYVQGGKEGTVDEFEVEPNGSLKSLASVLVPGAEGGEGIVAG
jgi:6-phosphogluconolactonase (cycloisomerase 2 family)